jgi:asperthecin polyketide synthase
LTNSRSLNLNELYSYHEATGREYELAESGTTLTALSVGLLSAAAVAVSTSISDLAFYGVESVRVAFRMGIHVQRVSQSLQACEPDSPPESWAYVVAGVTSDVIQEELDRFNHETVSQYLYLYSITDTDNLSSPIPNSQRFSSARQMQTPLV